MRDISARVWLFLFVGYHATGVITVYNGIAILLHNGIIQVLVFNECVSRLHRFYIVLAVRAFSIMLSLYSLCVIFKKPYYMRVCCANESVRHGFLLLNVPIMHRYNDKL